MSRPLDQAFERLLALLFGRVSGLLIGGAVGYTSARELAIAAAHLFASSTLCPASSLRRLRLNSPRRTPAISQFSLP
jgi:hypothetical protein